MLLKGALPFPPVFESVLRVTCVETRLKNGKIIPGEFTESLIEIVIEKLLTIFSVDAW
jgi:hypothetical protein